MQPCLEALCADSELCHCKWVFSSPAPLCPGTERELRFLVTADEIKIGDEKFCMAAVVWPLTGYLGLV